MKVRPLMGDERGSIVVVIVFIFTIALAGFMYTLIDGVLAEFIDDLVADVLPGGSSDATYSFLNYVWVFTPLFVLIVSGLWLINHMQKSKYREVPA